jgi:hypothetical protein
MGFVHGLAKEARSAQVERTREHFADLDFRTIEPMKNG